MLKGLFDPDGVFARAMDWVGRMVLLNVLFLLCSIPVITFGASSAALYGCIQKMQKGDDNKVLPLFFKTFAANFKTATLAWLILLPFVALCVVDLLVVPSGLWRMIATLGLQVCAMVAVLLFPLCARYENRPATHVKNAFLLAMGNLPRVLAIFVIWGIPIAACLLSGTVLYVLSIMWVLFGYAMLSWLNQALLWPIFDKLEA